MRVDGLTERGELYKIGVCKEHKRNPSLVAQGTGSGIYNKQAWQVAYNLTSVALLVKPAQL